MKKEKYYIFEADNGWGKEELFFSSERYFNEKLKVNSLTLLHLHFSDDDYYLFFGRKGYKNEVIFSFQFNKGNEFADFIISNGATYHKYDVVDVLESRIFFKFKLKDNRVIKLETHASDSRSGLLLYDVIEENNSSKEGTKDSLNLPIAELRLDKKDKAIAVKWSGTPTNNELPNTFKDFLAKEEHFKKQYPYYLIIFIVIIALILYYIF